MSREPAVRGLQGLGRVTCAGVPSRIPGRMRRVEERCATDSQSILHAAWRLPLAGFVSRVHYERRPKSRPGRASKKMQMCTFVRILHRPLHIGKSPTQATTTGNSLRREVTIKAA